MADTETVIHKGVVENAYALVKPPIPLPEAEAGSVVFVHRPYTWWERGSPSYGHYKGPVIGSCGQSKGAKAQSI